MGRGVSDSFESITERLEARVSRVSIAGRYHRLPCKLTDDYVISNEVIGVGANGNVMMATRRDSASAERYAVKTYALEALEPRKLQMLLSEVETFLYVDHPHIARLYGIYESAEHLHFVMESMQGGQLFDRFRNNGRFGEQEAKDAIWQILLALNYIHKHGIVHRDVKLENFVYEQQDNGRLKLIDFGFSKMFSSNARMKKALGTMLYVAPEVLQQSYTCQCDLWSLGVIAFVLLADYFPFSGDNLSESILAGNVEWRPDQWSRASEDASNFVRSLLCVDPQARLTAQAALQHPWILRRRRQSPSLGPADRQIAEALVAYGQFGKFRRCCMEMLAWCLSADDRAKVHDQFLCLDPTGRGTIMLSDLKVTMKSALRHPEPEVERIFAILDQNSDNEVNYTEFLAAMVSTRIMLQSSPIETVFRKFDRENLGYITPSGIRSILGDSLEEDEAEALLKEADVDHDGRLSYADFSNYLQSSHQDSLAKPPRGALRVAGLLILALGYCPFRCGRGRRSATAFPFEAS